MRMANEIANWTLEEVHRLPDDGNKYELVHGELFVTPPPSPAHESIGSVLNSIIEPYALAQRLGRVYRPRAVVQFEGSEVEPDLMVRPTPESLPEEWTDMPLPILVVEILSAATRRRDHRQKRDFYLDIGISEYWIVDREHRTIRVVRQGRADLVTKDSLVWTPVGAAEPLVLDVASFFREALG